MRARIGWSLVVLVSCGGGQRSTVTSPPPATGEPPQLVAARARRDAICACKDAACASRVPARDESKDGELTDPTMMRMMLEAGQDTLACLYRIRGVPPGCIAFVQSANKLASCDKLTDAEADALAASVEKATSMWVDVDWAAMPAAEKADSERACTEAEQMLHDDKAASCF